MLTLLHDDDIEFLSVQLMLKTTQNAKKRRNLRFLMLLFTNFCSLIAANQNLLIYIGLLAMPNHN